MYEPLTDYIKESSDATDIFCFQEIFRSPAGIKECRDVRPNIFSEVETLLPNFSSLFAPSQDRFDNTGPVNFQITVGQGIFAKKNIKIESHGSVFIYKELNGGADEIENLPDNMQFIRFSVDNKKYIVCNLHGIAYPGHKLDTPERLAQSRKIVEFLQGEDGTKILCGDFNLLPQTKSIAMIEETGMVNLIKKFKIERTRSRLSPFFGKPDFQKFADYTFVSPDVDVINFGVPDIDISDHMPMVLEFG